jgi:hypothetical protein
VVDTIMDVVVDGDVVGVVVEVSWMVLVVTGTELVVEWIVVVLHLVVVVCVVVVLSQAVAVIPNIGIMKIRIIATAMTKPILNFPKFSNIANTLPIM